MADDLKKTGIQLVAQGSAEFNRAMAGARASVTDFGRQSETGLAKAGRALEGAWGAAKEFAKGFGMAAGAVTALGFALMSLVDDAVDYIAAAGQTARVLSISTEEASRSIQVVDDLGVSQQAYTAAMRIAVREGITPTTEGLAQMSDHYLSLQTTQERAAYAQSVLGRNWMEFSRVLDAGGDRIRAMSAGISQSLIVTGNAYRMVELYRISTDSLSDSWMAFKMVLSQHVLPTMTLGITRIALQMQYMEQGEGFIAAWAHAITTADAAIAQMTADLEAAMPTLDQMPNPLDQMGSSLGNIAANAGAAGIAFDDLNVSIGDTIKGWMDQVAFLAAGGGDIQRAAQATHDALTAGRITPEEAQQIFGNLYAEAQNLSAELGDITPYEAARNIRDNLGVPFSEARAYVNEIRDTITNLPSQRVIEIIFTYSGPQEPPTHGRTWGYQHGGSFTVGGPGGADRSPVSFMATRGERVIVMPPQASPGASSYSDSHDTRTNNVSIQGQDLSNPFVIRKLFDSWLQGG